MARELTGEITRELVRVPEGLIIRPSAVPFAPPFLPPPFEPLRFNTMVLNIETTGIKPWDSRIIAISCLDVTDPAAETVVIMHEDEREILYEFLLHFKAGNYKTIIGYNLSFDYRYLIAKAMAYNLGCKEFFETGTTDMMRAMQYGRTTFFWGSQPSGKLTEWADYYFDDPKPFPDTDMIQMWYNGRWDDVKLFAKGQIRRTFNLWLLWTYSTNLSTQVGGEAGSTAPTGSNPSPSHSQMTSGNLTTVQCPVCKQEAVLAPGQETGRCIICGETLKR